MLGGSRLQRRAPTVCLCCSPKLLLLLSTCAWLVGIVVLVARGGLPSWGPPAPPGGGVVARRAPESEGDTRLLAELEVLREELRAARLELTSRPGGGLRQRAPERDAGADARVLADKDRELETLRGELRSARAELAVKARPAPKPAGGGAGGAAVERYRYRGWRVAAYGGGGGGDRGAARTDRAREFHGRAGL